MKRVFLIFTALYIFITLTMMTSLIIAYQQAQHSVEDTTVTSVEVVRTDEEYWTKERMIQAEPMPIPIERKIDRIIDFLINSLPIQRILFIIFTLFLLVYYMYRFQIVRKE